MSEQQRLIYDVSLLAEGYGLGSDLSAEMKKVLSEKCRAINECEHFNGPTIWTHGVPPLHNSKGPSGSDPAPNPLHEKANATEKDFGVWPEKSLYAAISIWYDFFEDLRVGKPQHFNTEADVARYVTELFTEVLRSIDLSATVDLLAEISVLGMRTDLWLVLRQQSPVGFIAIKKPNCDNHTDVLNDPLVHGQAKTHLLMVQQYFGVKNPIGLVCTYQQCRAYWLPESDVLATSTSPPSAQPLATAPSSIPSTLPEDVPSLSQAAPPERKETLPEEFRHELYCSAIFEAWRKDYVPFLATAVRKMCASQTVRLRLDLADKSRLYVYTGTERWRWCKLKEEFELDLSSLPPANTHNFFLLHDLRGGRDGRVWLAASVSGHACVIKFPRTPQAAASLQAEAEYWRTLWGFDARVQQFTPFHKGLIMPYVKVCTKELFEKAHVKRAVDKALARFEECDLYHDDMHVRHIGLYHDKDDNNALRAVIFDLTGVRKRNGPNQDSKAMSQKLLASVSEHDGHPPQQNQHALNVKLADTTMFAPFGQTPSASPSKSKRKHSPRKLSPRKPSPCKASPAKRKKGE